MDVDWNARVTGEPATTIAWRLAHLIIVFASTSVSRSGGPSADHATFRYRERIALDIIE